MNRGAAITGVGLVTAAGEEPLSLGETPAGAAAAGGRAAVPIEGFDVGSYVRRKGMRHLSRTSQLACAAAAKLAPAAAAMPGPQVGVVLGSAWAALDTIVRFEREAWTEGVRFVDPLLFTETVPNVPAGQVSIVFGWSALNVTLGGGATVGLEAVGRGIDLLDEGRASLMVAGGADALHHHLVRTLEADGRVNQPPCGEAACLLALEKPAAARARGAEVLGRVVSHREYAMGRSEDADQASAGLLRRLMLEADVPADRIDLVVAAAPELSSSRAIEQQTAVLGESASRAAVPPQLGDTWAASGPLAIVVALIGLRQRAQALGREAHGVVLGGGAAGRDRQLSAILVAVVPASC